jgi:DNA-binding GntR family transcriptional regulator
VKASLSDKAYEVLKQEIITCALEPGQQIVQQQLAKRYGLGMTPIREALQRLAQEGLVQPIPRFGYTVSFVTLADVHDIYELRLILEPAAARLAATRGTAEQLEAIAESACLRYTQREGTRKPDLRMHNAEFHRAIAAAAGNQRLLEAVSRVLDEMIRIFHLGLDLTASAGEMEQEHVQLVQALQARDADRAQEVMRQQIERSKQRVLEALMQRLGALGQAIPIGAYESKS